MEESLFAPVDCCLWAEAVKAGMAVVTMIIALIIWRVAK